MEAFEKLGAFYLGKKYQLSQRRLLDELILYDSKDLSTHAVIVGMTGSGKTGLGISMLEEALIDNIPVLAIDPKGDLTNLLLNFPELRPEDFLPWLHQRDAAAKGLTLEQFAKKQADMWRKGLAQWGQGPERLQRLKQSADFAIYTPGSNAGLTINLLSGFDPPQGELRDDDELVRETIKTLASSILTLAGLDTDPLTSREHILVSNIIEHHWTSGQRLDLGLLIGAISQPPFTRLGVMSLESFFPEKDRFALAMRLNNLLASPGFESWLQGAPLNIGEMLYSQGGKPRACIFCISHLNDQERMFFVSLLLNKVIGWMRSQPGTSSLKAVLYMDEVLGYMPPLGNPPSKGPLLTLLKQARAFGLGLVLATQNPVDLDYKGLSNAGTWFIGRLQTERDKARLMDGLEGVSPELEMDKGDLEEVLASLGKRVFLLHNVHESRPEVFHVRWAMSYLGGPLTRDQISQLMAGRKQLAEAAGPAPATPEKGGFSEPPMLPPGIEVGYLPASGAGAGLEYHPAVLGRLRIDYSNARYNIACQKVVALAALWQDDWKAPQWDEALELDPATGDALAPEPSAGASFRELPGAMGRVKSYGRWSKSMLSWARQNLALTLYRSKRFKAVSRPEESEDEFRGRLAHLAREKRDLAVEKLRRRYQGKFNTLQNRLLRAQQALEREKEQAQASKIDTLVSVGTAILGAFLGRKAVSSRTVSKVGTAIGRAGRARKQAMDVNRAKQTIAAIQQQMDELDGALQADIQKLEEIWDPAVEELTEIVVRPKSTQMALDVFCLAWLPYRKSVNGTMSPDW